MAAVDASESSLLESIPSMSPNSLCVRLRCAAFSTWRFRAIALALRKITTVPFVIDRDTTSNEPGALLVQFRDAEMRDRFLEDIVGQQIKGEDVSVDEVSSIEQISASAPATGIQGHNTVACGHYSRAFNRRRRRSVKRSNSPSSATSGGSAFQGGVPPERLPKMRRIAELRLRRTPRIAALSESVAVRVAPLACYSYATQLQMKHQLITSCLRGLTRKVFHHFYPREGREELLKRKAKEKESLATLNGGQSTLPEIHASRPLDDDDESLNGEEFGFSGGSNEAGTDSAFDQEHRSTAGSESPSSDGNIKPEQSGESPASGAPCWCHPKFSSGFSSCDLDEFVGADCPEARLGYRNKCEFTIGLGYSKGFSSHAAMDSCSRHMITSHHVRVGFVSQTLNFEPVVRSSSGCLHVPLPMQELCYRLQITIQERVDEFPVYSRRKREGLWRMAMIRTSNCENSMQLVVQVAPLDQFIQSKARNTSNTVVSGTETPPVTGDSLTKSVAALRAQLGTLLIANLVFDAAGRRTYNGYSLASILLNESTSLSDSLDKMDNGNTTIVFGTEILMQQIFGLQFRLGPSTFFQTNSIMCERLYQKAFQLAEVGDADLVIDVCCGSGAIALCLRKWLTSKSSKKLPKLIGVELVTSAVADARANAALNDIHDVEFFEGRAEAWLPDLLRDDGKFSGFGNIIVFVDPPRAGLHRSVINCILSCRRIQRVIYISCNPDSFVQDAQRFCIAPAFLTELPFRPSRAVGVDMFPHTYHCEMVTVLDRVKPNEVQSLQHPLNQSC